MTVFDTAVLSDTHCHLAFNEFDQDREQVLARARRAGVWNILIPGIDIETSRKAVQLAEAHEGVFAAVGIHPNYASLWNQTVLAEIRTLAASPKVVAIGEIGLDYYRDFSSPGSQLQAFKQQLELALELQLPVIIHNREAIDEILPILHSYSEQFEGMIKERRGVLHSFSADLSYAKAAIREGFYIGIAGPITYKNSEVLRTVAAGVPIEKVILETDSPYLTPSLHRGKRNEPAYLTQIAEVFAEVVDKDLHQITSSTTANAGKLFRLNHEN